MTPGDAELLAAILAAPERDEPRLVYADALLDRGDGLGELIQLQIAQARLLPRSAEFTRLQRRIDAIWATGWQAWTPKVAGLEAGTFCEWHFTRGFPTAVHTTPAAFVDAMADFFAAAPLLDELELDCGRLGPLALGTMGWLERMFAALRRLDLSLKTLRLHSLNDAGAVVLAGEPGLLAIDHLELTHTNLGTSTFQVLGGPGSAFLGLRRLELSMANARDAALPLLFAHPWPRLTELQVSHEIVGERGVRAITASGVMPALRTLVLSWSTVGGKDAIDVLAHCGTLPWLDTLDLSHCPITDAMAEALAGARGFSLKVLRLAHSGVGARGVRALLDAPVCSDLALLDLAGVVLDGPTKDAVVARFGAGVVLSTDDAIV